MTDADQSKFGPAPWREAVRAAKNRHVSGEHLLPSQSPEDFHWAWMAERDRHAEARRIRDRKYKRAKRARQAAAEGRTLRVYTDYSDMTRDEAIAHSKELERLKKRRQRAKASLTSHPLFGKF